MIVHVVLFRFDGDVQAAEEAERRLAALPAKVAAIRGLEVGTNVVPSDRAYDLGLIVRVDDEEALQAYREHPAHQEVVAYLREHATATAAVDFRS